MIKQDLSDTEAKMEDSAYYPQEMKYKEEEDRRFSE